MSTSVISYDSTSLLAADEISRHIPRIETNQHNNSADRQDSVKSCDQLHEGEIYYEVAHTHNTDNCFQTCFWCCAKKNSKVDVSYNCFGIQFLLNILSHDFY